MKNFILILCFCLICSGYLLGQSWHWANGLGGYDFDRVTEIVADSNENSYACGYFRGNFVFNQTTYTAIGQGVEMFVTKFDSLGNSIWIKRIIQGHHSTGLVGTTHSMKIDDENNLILVGSYTDSLIIDSFKIHPPTFNAYYSSYIAKFDTSGKCLWLKDYYNAGAWDVAVDKENNIYVAGDFNIEFRIDSIIITDSIFTAKGLLIKLDKHGNYLSHKTYGNRVKPCFLTSVDFSENGDCFLTGDFIDSIHINGYGSIVTNKGGMFMTKLDTNDNPIWVNYITTSYQQLSYFSDIHGVRASVSPGGRFGLSGRTYSDVYVGSDTLFQNTDHNNFLIELDGNGNFSWAHTIGKGTYQPFHYINLAYDKQDKLHAFGTGTDTINLGQTQLVSNDSHGGIYIAQFDSTGICNWALHEPSHSGLQSAKTICFSPNGNLFIGGDYLQSFSIGNHFIPYISYGDIFIARYNYPTILSDRSIYTSKQEPIVLTLFPNPCHDLLFIDLEKELDMIMIYTLNGQLIKYIIKPSNQLDVGNLPSGVYILKGRTSNELYQAKFVKE